jgi:hypothetical protein
MRRDVQRAIAARDAAFARIRLVTGVAVAAGVALTGAFAALAAGATHLRKTVVTTHVAPPPTHTKHTQPPVSAPAPPLVSAGGSASETPPPAPPSTSYSAPTPTPAPPVVVSGGS